MTLRSVGARLSLALLVVLAGAFVIAYLVLVPSFELALVRAKVDAMGRSAKLLAAAIGPERPRGWQDAVDAIEGYAHARAVVLRVEGKRLVLAADSSRRGMLDVAHEPILLRAAATGRAESGRRAVGGESYALAAVPMPRRRLVVALATPLTDTLATVALAQRRLLIAAAVALTFALALGYLGASYFARRLRRLEQSAERIAAGRFDEPIAENGRDEIGQLGRTFERMRLQLAQLDRARSEFIGNASHELRTPLFSLGGFLELLDDGELDDATRDRFVAEMRAQVERLRRLAEDLLDLSRLDAGRMTVERTPVDLAALAAQVTREFAARAAQGGRLLELADGDTTFGVGDDDRAARIVRILVENALLHTPPGTRVTVRVDGASVAVVDDGPGIPADDAELVFERFARLDGARAGSGLGLAIARELAQLMDGRVELDSRPGRTAFSLVLAAVPTGRDAMIAAHA